METENEKSSQSKFSFQSVLSSIPVDWMTIAFQFYRLIESLWKGKSHEGLYEMLDYDAVLELEDSKGNTALFQKRQRVKFLQDNVIAFQDHVWGDGQVFGNYHCSPGVVVDRYEDGDRWNVLISLRETKSSGDIEDFHIERKIKHGFTNADEWWQIEMQHQTRRLKLAIVFPKARHCRRAVVFEKTRNRSMPLAPECFAPLPDGRQVLTWENKQPRRFETYTIKWKW